MSRYNFATLKNLTWVFVENTDKEHPAYAQDVIKYLNSLRFRAERKAIYTDVDVLRKFGLNIVKCGKGFYYKVG